MREKLRKEHSDIYSQHNRFISNKEAGITLVALVVTIVVLLVLAGITLVYVYGDNGVFGKATEAKIATELGKIEEQAGIIYAGKFIEKQGEKVKNRDIIDELIKNGNKIEIRNVGSEAVTGIVVEPPEVVMNENETTIIKVRLEDSEDGNIYYTVIDGKYYKINFQGSQIAIEREATAPEGNIEEPLDIEVVTGYETAIVTKAEINQSAKTIELTSGTKYGTTTITVKYGSNTADCKVIVEETESNWGEIAEMAKQIANNSSITSSSEQATVTIDGESKDIKVGDICKVKYNGELKKVRILGFKHDDLVDQGAYKDGKEHEKAGISFEFLDFMTGASYMAMNSSNTTTGGWASTKMRTDLNGSGSSIGGLGGNLSNKGYIKQVTKKYIATHSDSGSVIECNDYLWLIASSEIVPQNSDSTRYGYAVTTEGSQYKYYQGVTEGWTVGSTNRQKGPGSSDVPYHWWLRSPDYYHSGCFCVISSTGLVYDSYNYASGSCGVAPGFCI